MTAKFHKERDKVKINKYVYFHCKLIVLTQTVSCVGKNIFILKYLQIYFHDFGQFSTIRGGEGSPPSHFGDIFFKHFCCAILDYVT